MEDMRNVYEKLIKDNETRILDLVNKEQENFIEFSEKELSLEKKAEEIIKNKLDLYVNSKEIFEELSKEAEDEGKYSKELEDLEECIGGTKLNLDEMREDFKNKEDVMEIIEEKVREKKSRFKRIGLIS